MRQRGPAATARHRAGAPEERSLTAPVPRFIGSFPRADAPLDPPLPEIAFIGRSNVGKSSLLNAVTGTRIAKVSGTPGKTRMLNVFLVHPGSGEWGAVPDDAKRDRAPHRQVPLPTPHSLYFLDLPGYGYSRASKTDRTAFRRLVAHALRREQLAGAVWLLDVRREPSADDWTMQDLLAAAGTRVLATVTKSDKLRRGARVRREQELRETLRLDADQIIV